LEKVHSFSLPTFCQKRIRLENIFAFIPLNGYRLNILFSIKEAICEIELFKVEQITLIAVDRMHTKEGVVEGNGEKWIYFSSACIREKFYIITWIAFTSMWRFSLAGVGVE
jgi:hypothetical protein